MTTARVDAEFTAFVREAEPRLSYALAAAYGVEVGAETTDDSLAYAWEHWSEVGAMDNPVGHLYRVASQPHGWHDPDVTPMFCVSRRLGQFPAGGFRSLWRTIGSCLAVFRIHRRGIALVR